MKQIDIKGLINIEVINTIEKTKVKLISPINSLLKLYLSSINLKFPLKNSLRFMYFLNSNKPKNQNTAKSKSVEGKNVSQIKIGENNNNIEFKYFQYFILTIEILLPRKT